MTWDNRGMTDTRRPSRRCCCAARDGAEGLGRAGRRAGREGAAGRRARSARRPERPIAPPAPPAAADAVRPALGKARSRPAQAGAGGSRTGGGRGRGRGRRRPIRRCARPRSEKRRRRAASLPEHLPRVEIVIEPEDTACPCCGGAMHVIGEDRSQRLDMIPAQFRVIVTRRPEIRLPRLRRRRWCRRRRRRG